jgi:hypothetical protein
MLDVHPDVHKPPVAVNDLCTQILVCASLGVEDEGVPGTPYLTPRHVQIASKPAQTHRQASVGSFERREISMVSPKLASFYSCVMM